MPLLLGLTSFFAIFDASTILKAMDRNELINYYDDNKNISQILAIDNCALGLKLISTS